MHQPVLRSDERLYIMTGSADRHFVLSLPQATTTPEQAAQLEAVLADATQYRQRGGDGGLLDYLPSAVPSSVAELSTTVANAAATVYTKATTITAAEVGGAVSTAVVFTGKAVSAGLVAGAEYAGWGLQWYVVRCCL
jgi:hypothetical protein